MGNGFDFRILYPLKILIKCKVLYPLKVLIKCKETKMDMNARTQRFTAIYPPWKDYLRNYFGKT